MGIESEREWYVWWDSGRKIWEFLETKMFDKIQCIFIEGLNFLSLILCINRQLLLDDKQGSKFGEIRYGQIMCI